MKEDKVVFSELSSIIVNIEHVYIKPNVKNNNIVLQIWVLHVRIMRENQIPQVMIENTDKAHTLEEKKQHRFVLLSK